jgi:hypothetical protein
MGPAGLNGIDGTAGTNGTDGADGAAGTNGTNGTGTNGTNGAKGDNGLIGGIVLSGGAVDADTLKAAFDSTQTTVILWTGVTSVYGEIPANKTLRVLVPVVIPDGEALTLKGSLDIYLFSASLQADAITGTSGGLILEGDGVSVTGVGALSLPLDTDGAYTGDYATYKDVGYTLKEVGSLIASDTLASAAFDPTSLADVAAFLNTADGPGALTVTNLTGITSATIPAGTLTLEGPGNTITDASFAPVGTVINNGTVSVAFTTDTEVTNIFSYVSGNITASGAITTLSGDFTVPANVRLTLSDSGTTFASAEDVTVEGTLTLNGVTAFAPGAGVIVNGELVVDSSSDIEPTGTFSGTGVVKAYGGGTITITGAAYTTATANGIAANAINAAAAAIAAEAVLTDSVDLDTAFNNGGGTINGIGSVTLTGDAATVVLDGNDGSTGSPVTVSSGISLAGSLDGTGASGQHGTDLDGGTVFTLSLAGNELSIADSAYDGSTGKLGVIAFNAVQLQHGELIGPVVPAFHIGVSTSR